MRPGFFSVGDKVLYLADPDKNDEEQYTLNGKILEIDCLNDNIRLSIRRVSEDGKTHRYKMETSSKHLRLRCPVGMTLKEAMKDDYGVTNHLKRHKKARQLEEGEWNYFEHFSNQKKR